MDKMDGLRERWLVPGEDLQDAFDVRIDVFCREQGYTVDMELDGLDPLSDHLVLYDGELPAATGRLFMIGDGPYGIGRVAVRKSYRGQGLGARMLSLLIERAGEKGAAAIELDAQCRAMGFYRKFGFEPMGEEHMDGPIPHKKMKKLL